MGFPGRLAILCQQVLHRTLGIGETAVPRRIAKRRAYDEFESLIGRFVGIFKCALYSTTIYNYIINHLAY